MNLTFLKKLYFGAYLYIVFIVSSVNTYFITIRYLNELILISYLL